MEANRPDDSSTSPRRVGPCVSPAFNSAPSSADFPAPVCPNRSTCGVPGGGSTSTAFGSGVDMVEVMSRERFLLHDRSLIAAPVVKQKTLPARRSLRGGGEHHVESGLLG